jgi:PIN domain nuclease of toxin-antitoxin system
LSVLLDTHVWIWWLMGQPELPLGQRIALDRLAERELPFLSAISLWEAQMLNAKGRLKLNRPFKRWLREAASPEVVRVLLLDRGRRAGALHAACALSRRSGRPNHRSLGAGIRPPAPLFRYGDPERPYGAALESPLDLRPPSEATSHGLEGHALIVK